MITFLLRYLIALTLIVFILSVRSAEPDIFAKIYLGYFLSLQCKYLIIPINNKTTLFDLKNKILEKEPDIDVEQLKLIVKDHSELELELEEVKTNIMGIINKEALKGKGYVPIFTRKSNVDGVASKRNRKKKKIGYVKLCNRKELDTHEFDRINITAILF